MIEWPQHNGSYMYVLQTIDTLHTDIQKHSIVVIKPHTIRQAKWLSHKYLLKAMQKSQKNPFIDRVHPSRPFTFHEYYVNRVCAVCVVYTIYKLHILFSRFKPPFFTLINYKSYAIGIQKSRYNIYDKQTSERESITLIKREKKNFYFCYTQRDHNEMKNNAKYIFLSSYFQNKVLEREKNGNKNKNGDFVVLYL